MNVGSAVCDQDEASCEDDGVVPFTSSQLQHALDRSRKRRLRLRTTPRSHLSARAIRVSQDHGLGPSNNEDAQEVVMQPNGESHMSVTSLFPGSPTKAAADSKFFPPLEISSEGGSGSLNIETGD